MRQSQQKQMIRIDFRRRSAAWFSVASLLEGSSLKPLMEFWPQMDENGLSKKKKAAPGIREKFILKCQGCLLGKQREVVGKGSYGPMESELVSLGGPREH